MRIESPLDEMFDARDETIGLARAGTRHDEHGAERRFDRAALLGKRGECQQSHNRVR